MIAPWYEGADTSPRNNEPSSDSHKSGSYYSSVFKKMSEADRKDVYEKWRLGDYSP